MKRSLLRSSAFIRRAKKALKKHPQWSADLHSTLDLLATDCFHPRLKTHKLKAELEGSWACSAGYDLRIAFKFVEYEGAEAILLLPSGPTRKCTDPLAGWRDVCRSACRRSGLAAVARRALGD